MRKKRSQWTVFSRRYTAFSGISGRRTNKKLKSGYQRRARPWKTWNVEPHERGERVYGYGLSLLCFIHHTSILLTPRLSDTSDPGCAD